MLEKKNKEIKRRRGELTNVGEYQLAEALKPLLTKIEKCCWRDGCVNSLTKEGERKVLERNT